MKIAIYAISLNEAKFVDRFMDACAPADHIVIADTGSSDDSVERFRARGADVHAIRIDPWRFDAARNAALALVPADVDVCFSLDIDEVPACGWRQALERGWSAEATKAHYRFVSSHLADGSPGVEFLNARIHTRHGYRWRHICHEAVYPEDLEEVSVTIPDLRVDHYPDQEKSRGNYLGMLQRAAREEPDQPRMAHYLAREYYYYRQYDAAIAEFRRYLDMNGHFTSERVASMIYIGNALAEQGRDPTPWRHRAIAEQPENREAWVALAETCYKREEWPQCYAAAVKALSLAPLADGYMRDPRCYGALPDDLASLGAWHIGLVDKAIAHVRAALRHAPDDQRLMDNLAYMEQQGAAHGASAPSIAP